MMRWEAMRSICASAAKWTVVLIVGACVLSVSGCKGLADKATPYESRLTLVDGGEVTVVMGQLGTRPGQLLTAAERLSVNVAFDPKLIRFDKAKTFTLWSRLHQPASGKREAWNKLGTAPIGEAIPSIALEEGLVGLRASVTYDDGSEELLPRRTHDPALWLIVDRAAPRLKWVEPTQRTSLINLRNVRLEWHAQETRFGDEPYRLQWSGDDGATWRTIASVPAAPGKQRYRWWLPSDAVGNLLVRVEAEDFAGHCSSAILPLVYYPTPHARADGERALARGAAGSTAEQERDPVAGDVEATTEAAEAARPADRSAVSGADSTHAAGAGTDDDSASGPTLAEWLPDNVPPNLQHLVRGTHIAQGPVEGSEEGGATLVPTRAQGGEATLSKGTALTEGTVPAVGTGAEGTLQPSALRGDGASAVQDGVTTGAVRRHGAEVFPELRLGAVPAVCGRAGLVVPYTLKDPGGLGVEEIQSYVRLRGAGGWSLLPPERLILDERTITLELPGFSAAEYEFYFRPVDRAGDAGLLPGPWTRPHGRFRLDLTAPQLIARGSSLAWVGGFDAEVEVETEWDEITGPLNLEGYSADGRWETIRRWDAPMPGGQFRFPLPVGVAEYKVRFSASDAAGNRGETTLGPRAVESSIRFASFVKEGEVASGTVSQIKWALHPVATAEQDSLEVGIWHQAQRGGSWTLLEKVPAVVRFLWDLPATDDHVHRLRIRLFRGSTVVGEGFSAPFRVTGASGVAPLVPISGESRFYTKQARAQIERFDAALADRSRGLDNPRELAGFAKSVEVAFRKALELDAKNYEAAYGLAQFLNRLDPVANAAAVRRLLNQAIEVNPVHFWALNDLGALYIQDADFPRAQRVLERAVELKSRAIALYNLGLALFYQRRMTDARRRFDQALRGEEREQVPEGEIYYYVIHSHLQDGDVDSARRVFDRHGSDIPAELRDDLSSSL
jgi:hypothetical protein